MQKRSTTLRMKLAASVALLAMGQSLLPVHALAAFGEAPAIPSSFGLGNNAAGTPSGVPFGSCMTGGVSQIFTNIGDAFQNAVNSGESDIKTLTRALTGSTPAGGGCGAATAVKEDYQCSELLIGGKLNTAAIEKFRAQSQQAVQSYNCQKGKLNMISSELSCLQTKASGLTAFVESMGGFFAQQMQPAIQYVQASKSFEQDVTAQVNQAGEKLNGNRQVGKKGLLQLQEDARKMQEEMPAQVNEVNEQFAAIVEQEKQLKEMQEIRTAQAALGCFQNKVEANYVCSPGTPPVKIDEYIKCRCAQSELLAKDGKRIETSGKASLEKKSLAKAAEVDAVVKAMIEGFPKDGVGGGKNEQAYDGGSRPYQVLTMEDFSNAFLPRFRALSCRGLNVEGFVKNAMARCFAAEGGKVGAELKRSSSTLGQFKYRIEAQRRLTNAKTTQLFDRYRQTLTDIKTALVGQDMPFTTLADLGIPNGNLNFCKNAKPDVQKECLQRMMGGMDSLLSGTAPNSSTVLTMKGTSSQSQISCNGLNGCITAMQSFVQEGQTVVQKTQNDRKQQVQMFNQKANEWVKQQQGMVSAQNQALASEVAKINALLASLGVSGDVNFKTKKGGKLETDSEMDGLVMAPENMGELLGVADLQPGSFSGALSGISKKSGELDEKIGEAQSSTQRLLAMVEPCKQEGLNQLADKAQRDLESLNTNRCFYSVEICQRGDSLSDLLADLQSAGMGGDSSSVDALYNGISDFCAQSDVMNTGPDLRATATIQDELRAKQAEKAAEIAKTEPNQARITSMEGDITRLSDELRQAQQRDREQRPTNPGSCRGVFAGLESKTKAISEAAERRVPLTGRAASGL